MSIEDPPKQIQPQSNLSLRKRLLFSFIVLLLAPFGLELLFRTVTLATASSNKQLIDNYRNEWAPAPLELGSKVMFAPHAHMVYTFNPNVDLGVGSHGFYFADLPLKKPNNTLRIATFGGSTTGGPHAWPYWLGRQLEANLNNKKVEVLNFGVGGWTSAEGVVAYTHLARSYDLDGVVIHHVNNDISPIRQYGFQPDYSHFRRPAALVETDGVVSIRWTFTEALDDKLTRWSDLYIYLRMWTVGPPIGRWTLNNFAESRPDKRPISKEEKRSREQVLERNYDTIGTLTEADGGTVVVLTMPSQQTVEPNLYAWKEELAEMNEFVSSVANKHGWILVDAANDDGFTSDFFSDPIHVTNSGQQYKATLVSEALLRNGFGQQ